MSTPFDAPPDPIPPPFVASGTPASAEEQAIALAKAPPPAKRHSASLLVALSLGAFLLAGRGSQTVEQIVMLLVVLFIHEGGHIAGMHLFGYSDLRMFFVPFVGALASGRKRNAPGWQRAIVLLLGPLPGLFLSLVLVSASGAGMARAFAWQLLFINGLNLFPLVPLDGGRFVQLLFARHPRVQAAFAAIGLVVFGGFMIAGGNWIVAAMSAFLLMLVPVQLRIAKAGAALRAAWGTVPPLSELSDAAARDLYARVSGVSSVQSPQPPLLASLMRQVHEHAASEPVGPAATVALVGAYAGGFVLILVNLVIFAVRTRG
jgi:hypothetical protein